MWLVSRKGLGHPSKASWSCRVAGRLGEVALGLLCLRDLPQISLEDAMCPFTYLPTCLLAVDFDKYLGPIERSSSIRYIERRLNQVIKLS